MLTGFKGVKYGLAVPKSEPKAPPKKTIAAFADDDSEDEQQQVAKAIERQAQRKQNDAKVNSPHEYSSKHIIIFKRALTRFTHLDATSSQDIFGQATEQCIVQTYAPLQR